MKKRFGLLVMLSFLMMTIFAVRTFAASGKPVELKFAHFLPPMHHEHVEVFVPLAREIEERTHGKVKVTIYPAQALGKAKDLYDIAKNGVADMTFFIPGYTSGRFPLTTVMELPLNAPSAKVGTRVIWDLYGKYLKPEYTDVKLLSMWTNQPAQIFTSKKPVKSLEDLRGLRIRSPGPQQTFTLKTLGASPVSLPAPDVYDALQRGMVDGVATDFAAVKNFRFIEVANYATIVNLYLLPMGLAMNLDVWNSFSPDIKKIMEEIFGLRTAKNNAKTFDKHNLLGQEAWEKKGLGVYQLSAEEKKIWEEKFKLINEKWVADMEAKGLPGKRVFEEANMLLKRYSK
jgi:TRAP-type C4-dicarboxylate transport system substrate-binding protein